MTNINQGFTRLFNFIDEGKKDPSKLEETVGKKKLSHEAGIKARDTSKMHPVQKFFAKLFGHTIDWNGKTYLVGTKSLEAFVRRNTEFKPKSGKLDVDKALSQ